MFRRKKELQSLVNTSRKSLANAENKIEQRNKVIKNLYEETQDLKEKIIDLENNIELLVNNLSEKEKALLVLTILNWITFFLLIILIFFCNH